MKKTMKKKMTVNRRVDLQSNSLSYEDANEDFALVTVVVASATPVYREEDGEPFYRELKISEDAIRFDRFMNGAPVLDNHNDGARGQSVSGTLGSVDKTWIEGEGKDAKLMARLKISKISEADREIAKKIKNGIITSVSVGAFIHNQRMIESADESDDGVAKVLADDWEPHEVSLVMVPADDKAIIRNLQINLDNKESSMSEQTTIEEMVSSEVKQSASEDTMKQMEERIDTLEQALGDLTESKPKEERVMEDEDKDKQQVEGEDEEKEEGMEETQQAVKDALMKIKEAYPDLDDQAMSEAQETLENMIEKQMPEKLADEKTLTQLSKMIASDVSKKLYNSNSTPDTKRRTSMGNAYFTNNQEKKRKELAEEISDVLVQKVTRGEYGNYYKKKNAGKELPISKYDGASLVNLAREFVYQYGHTEEARRLSNNELYDFLLGNKITKRTGGPIAVSSDFANLLSSSMEKTVLTSYETKRGMQTFDPFVTRQTVDNFKEQERTTLGESGELELVAPGADATIHTMSDTVEKFKVDTYSKTFQLTRQAFVNDDTGQLQAVLTSGAAAADKESDLVYNQLVNGRVQGGAWYSNANRNYHTGANTNLGNTGWSGIKNIYKSLALQTGLDVSTPLNLQFGYLLVPVSLNFEANQTKMVQFPDDVTKPNPYASLYQIIVEPRLDSTSDNGRGGHADGETAYYGIAKEAKMFRPFLELATITGQPIMKYEESFSNDVLSWKVTHDLGVKILDYRLAVKVKGAA